MLRWMPKQYQKSTGTRFKHALLPTRLQFKRALRATAMGSLFYCNQNCCFLTRIELSIPQFKLNPFLPPLTNSYAGVILADNKRTPLRKSGIFLPQRKVPSWGKQ
jgi:hypothetical protein